MKNNQIRRLAREKLRLKEQRVSYWEKYGILLNPRDLTKVNEFNEVVDEQEISSIC